MKKLYIIGLISASLATAFTSCRDDFDYNEAYRQNPEFVYKENFEKAFGEIAPDQSWDFSNGYLYGDPNQATRATRAAISTQADLDSRWSTGDDWYYVPNATILELQDALPEDVNNTSKGHSFVCKVPDCDFYLIPVFQGRNPMQAAWLKMTVTYNGNSQTYTIWNQKEEDDKDPANVLIQKTYCPICHGDGEYCSHCGGDGLLGTCSNCGGDGRVGLLISRTCSVCEGKGKIKCDFCEGSGNHNEICVTCNGTGGDWTPANTNADYDKTYAGTNGSRSGNTGTTTGYINNYLKATKGIRSKKLKFKRGDIPAGAILTFTAHSNYSGSGNGNNYYSTPTTGDAYILAVNDTEVQTRPTKPATDLPDEFEYMFISSEAGANSDLNDIVMMFAGERIPQEIKVTGGEDDVPNEVSKRYMVEDLGATAISDIDFNDIVLDFNKKTNSKVKITVTTYEDKTQKIEEEPIPNSRTLVSQTMKVRALGGTKNIAVYLRKGNTPNPATDPCLFIKDGTQPKNTTYYNNSATASGFTAKYMYNTVYSSNPKQAELKNYVLDYDTDVTLATVDLGTSDEWDEVAHNVYVVVSGSNSGELTFDDEDQVIEFPERGTVPAIIAVDVNDPWNWERANVFKELDASTGNVFQLVDGTTNSWKDYPIKK